MRVGVIADTHGYLDPRVPPALDGVSAILHAGDVGGRAVLDALAEIAPVYAVRGNNDDKLGGLGLPSHVDLTLGGVRIHVVHQLPHARPPEDTRVVVFGHSHRTLIGERDGVVYLNPGAAGRAGFHRVQTVAVIECARGRPSGARIIELGPREPARVKRSRTT